MRPEHFTRNLDRPFYDIISETVSCWGFILQFGGTHGYPEFAYGKILNLDSYPVIDGLHSLDLGSKWRFGTGEH